MLRMQMSRFSFPVVVLYIYSKLLMMHNCTLKLLKDILHTNESKKTQIYTHARKIFNIQDF